MVTLHRRTHAEDWWDEWRAGYWATRPPTEQDPRTLAEAERGMYPFLEAAHEAERTEQIPSGEYFWVRVFHTEASRAGLAARLTDDLFDGPKDEVWAPDDTGTFARRRPPLDS